MLMDRKTIMVKNRQKHVENPHLHYSHDVLLSSKQKLVTDRMESGFWTSPASSVTLTAGAVLAGAGGRSVVMTLKVSPYSSSFLICVRLWFPVAFTNSRDW